MNDRKNMYALIIGVGDDLPYTIEDASKIRNTLVDPNLIGYPEENVILLTDKAATRQGIFDAFEQLQKKTDENSSVLLYYSGHGGKYEDKHKFFLQPYGMTAENYKDTWVKAEELTEKINALKSNKLVFLLDCCHAEGMTQEGLNNMQGLAQKLNDTGGMWVISACQDDQKSWRLPHRANSLFTECVLEVLAGRHKFPFIDPNVTITDVVEYIFEEVPKRASASKDKYGNQIEQTPFAKFQMSENVVLSTFPKNIETHEAIIKNLEPRLDALDERNLLRLLSAMEAVGRTDEAIVILENNDRTQSDADLLNALGDLYKGKYINNNEEPFGQAALKCHKRALELAVSDEDDEQIYLNAINLAFLYLMLDLNKKQMRAYAQQAFDVANSYFYPSVEKSGTMGEALIYLNQLDKAKIYYVKVSEEGGIRSKMKIYTDAQKAFSILYNDNPDDEFLLFLKEKLLSL